jgi:hypothetical protein
MVLLHPGLAMHLGLAQGRAGRHFVIRLETIDILPGKMALDQLLDIIQLLDLVRTHQ